MKVLIVADGRSPTARSWIKRLQEIGIEVSLVSTYPCSPVDGVDYLRVLPVAFGRFAGSQVGTGEHLNQKNSLLRRLVGLFRNLLVAARYSLGPQTRRLYRGELLNICDEVKPNLVHALRIPFEGMLAVHAPKNIPLVVTTWGNDLSLHARRNKIMKQITRQVLARADGMMADTQREIRLAEEMGFDTGKPSLVVPGSGGMDLKQVLKTHQLSPELESMIPSNSPLIINPRGFRPGSVRNDVFFQATAKVGEARPDVHFICAAMAGQREAINWVKKLGVEKNVHLLPYLSQEQLWALFQRSMITASISEHDGTPNTLLEAMALGCFPICGDIESIREWITNEENGLLVAPASPISAADAILRALDDTDLRNKAKRKNLEIIKARAGCRITEKLITAFYKTITTKTFPA